MDKECESLILPSIILFLIILISCLICCVLISECREQKEEKKQKKVPRVASGMKLHMNGVNGKSAKLCEVEKGAEKDFEKTKLLETLTRIYTEKEKLTRNSSFSTV